MNRVEFINRTCMDDEVRKSVLEFFWDQFMLVCELSDNVEQVMPMPINIGNGQITFQIVYSDADSATKMKQMIESNSCFIIYEKQFSVSCWMDTHPNVLTVMIN